MFTALCAVCYSQTNVELCQQCKIRGYYSEAYQVSDSPSHKILYSAISQQSSRPTPDHVRGIFSPADRRYPELIWLPVRNYSESEDPNDTRIGPDEDFINDAYLARPTYDGEPDFNFSDVEQVRWNLRLQRFAPRLLQFYFRDSSCNDSSGATASLATVVGPYGLENRGWRGPLVVAAFSVTPAAHFYKDLLYHGETGGGKIEVADVTLADLRGVGYYSLGVQEGRDQLGRDKKAMEARMKA